MSHQIENTPDQEVKPEWHTKLVQALEQCEQYEKSKSPVGSCLGLIAFVVVANIVLFYLGAIFTDEFKSPPPGIFVLLLFFVGAFLARIFVFYPATRLLVKRSKASLSHSALQEVFQQTRRRPVLYLRSFSMDDDMSRLHWFHRYYGYGAWFSITPEEQLVGALYQLGPVIAIGKPSESLPELGAARFYASDENWQAMIQVAIESSQLVVWMTGVSDGLEWEIRTLTQNLAPSKLLVACHPQLRKIRREEKESEWSEFREKMEQHFPEPFPEELGDTRFFIFDENWNPTPVSGRKQPATIRNALTQLQESRSLEQPRKPLGCMVVALYLACPILGVISGGLIGGFIGEAPGFIVGSIAGVLVGLTVGCLYLYNAIKKWKLNS